MSLFDTVLVANRGEIAVRVIRTLRRLGIRSVAVYSDSDADARHVREADLTVHLGPTPASRSYLSVDRVVEAALRSGAQAVHPGYGFLSENPVLAAALHDVGVVFVGPPVAAIEAMADKITAKNLVASAGVPVVPGIARPRLTDADLLDAAQQIGYPVLVKPSAGGGGKGMHVVEDAAELPAALTSARRESASAFGDDTLFLERYVTRPRHIEVQVVADRYGAVLHLGERECSLQRRHQKVIEEAPSPAVDTATRERLGVAACETARRVGYEGVGTVEFVVPADSPDEFFFLEMNTRLQVEHPVTELVTGVDLVEWQLRIAAGEALPMTQDEVVLHGHAVEARIYAEDPAAGFLPTGGTILAVVEPTGVRIDSGVDTGTEVGSAYDPMLAKVVAHDVDRASALRRLHRALGELVMLGVVTNTDFLRQVLADAEVEAGRLDTGLLDRLAATHATPPVTDEVFVAAAACRWLRLREQAGDDLWRRPDGWRIGRPGGFRLRLQVGARTETVVLSGSRGAARARVGDRESAAVVAGRPHEPELTVDGIRSGWTARDTGDTIWVHGLGTTTSVAVLGRERLRETDTARTDEQVRSPMPGTVIAVPATDGTTVSAGAPLVVVEAMKMEHTLNAAHDGVVTVHVQVGAQVRVGELLAEVNTPEEPS